MDRCLRQVDGAERFRRWMETMELLDLRFSARDVLQFLQRLSPDVPPRRSTPPFIAFKLYLFPNIPSRGKSWLLFTVLLVSCGLVFYFYGHASQLSTTKAQFEVFGKQLYVRDYLGYLYPQGYFEVPPQDIKSSLKNIRGQHSDTILPKCNESTGIDPALTNNEVGWEHPKKYLPNYKNPCWSETINGQTKLQCVPYFYVIGQSKCGSTDIYNRINQHPHVVSTREKEYRWFELHRFLKDSDKKTFSSYVRRFQSQSDTIEKLYRDTGYHHIICGDASPEYSWDNTEWFRLPENQYCLEPRATIMSYIHHLTTGAKLILVLRNPPNRLYSHYLYHGRETGCKGTAEEFHEWVTVAINKYKECFKSRPFRQCLYSKKIKGSLKFKAVPSTIYSRIVVDILKVFPREQLFVVRMEDVNDRLRDLFDFLGLDRLPDAQMAAIKNKRKANAGRYYSKAGPMLQKTRQMLLEFFKPFNEELALMLNDEKYLWREN